MIGINVDVSQFTAGMSEMEERQVPFAIKNALNAVGLDVQVAERQRLRDVFTIRRPAYADRAIKITFATKQEPYTTVAIQPPGGGSDIFGKFEDQTEKLPLGSHGVAVPIDARRNKADIIVKGQRPKDYHLHREGARIVGDNGTYIVKLSDGRELLLQRKDLGKRAAKKQGRGTNERATLLYIFVPRVRIHPNLQFVPSAEQIVDRMWVQRWGEAFTQAMSTAL